MLKKLIKILLISVIIFFSFCMISKVSAKNWILETNYQREYNTKHKYKTHKITYKGRRVTLEDCTEFYFYRYRSAERKSLHLFDCQDESLGIYSYSGNGEAVEAINYTGVICGQHDVKLTTDNLKKYQVLMNVNIDELYIQLEPMSKLDAESFMNGYILWAHDNLRITNLGSLAFALSNLELDLYRGPLGFTDTSSQIGTWKYLPGLMDFLVNDKKYGVDDLNLIYDNYNWLKGAYSVSEYTKNNDYIKKLIKNAKDYDTYMNNCTYGNSERGTCEFKEPKSNLNTIQATFNGNSYIVGPINLYFNEASSTYRSIDGQTTTTEYFAGIDTAKVYDIDGNIITNWAFCDANGQAIEPHSEQDFYISVPSNVKGVKNIEFSFKNLNAYAEFYMVKNWSGNQLQLYVIEAGRKYENQQLKLLFTLNFTGNLIIIKQDEYRPSKRLAGVEFKMMNSLGQYVRINNQNRSQGIIVVNSLELTSEAGATTFVTDGQGMFGIFNIAIGDYKLIEVSVGANDRYAVKGIIDNIVLKPDMVVTDQTASYATPATSLVITNKIRYIKLSGRVWEDIAFSGTSSKSKSNNYLYKNGALDNDNPTDPNYQLLGIPVSIKDNNGNIVRNSKGQLCQTTTRADGTYEFDYVDVEQLANYKIEFEYNGMKYEPVNVYYEQSRLKDYYYGTMKEKSSKVADTLGTGNKTRQKLNIDYGTITSTSTINYKEDEYSSKVDYKKPEYYNKDELYNVIADTTSGGYYLNEHYDPAIDYDHIQHLNFGIVEREQPDIAVGKDIEEVRVSINGKTHIYKYADRKFNIADSGNAYEYPQTVKFYKKAGTYGGMTYERAVYASDVLNANNIENKGETVKEEDRLKVDVIYKIDIKNQSTNLNVRVNKLNEYYDPKYKGNENGENNIIAGYELEQEGARKGLVKNQINVGQTVKENDKFNKVELQPNIEIAKQKSTQIYVMLEVKQEALEEVVRIGEETNESLPKVNFDNIVEIISYTTIKNGNVIAGIDVDSRPDNANVDNIIEPEKVAKGTPTTYEDDTDRAPGFILQLNSPRETTGTVFIDDVERPEGIEETENLMVNKQRRGDGEYKEENDQVVKNNVTVELVYKDENGEEKVADVYIPGQNGQAGRWDTSRKTLSEEDKGNYKIEGFIPGDYQIKFTWGDGTYKVQNYKGTVYTKTRRDNTATNENKTYEPEEDIEWYKKDGINRYSDAIDNYETRENIDEQIKLMTNGNKGLIEEAYNSNTDVKIKVESKEENVITRMDSYTPKMNVRLEYEDNNDIFEEVTGSNKVSEREYKIQNIDFGIIERPRQEICLEKRISGVNLKLANGAILVDAKVVQDENGKYKLEEEIPYVVYLPNEEGTDPLLKLEIDKEIIQGATLEIEYEFIVENLSEIDYVTEEYYKYGEESTDDKLVTLTPNEVIEYLDNQVSVPRSQENWEHQTSEKIEKLYEEAILSSQKELKEYVDSIERIYKANLKEITLKPGDMPKIVASFVTSKLLSNTDTIVLNNEAEIIKLTKTGGSTLVSTPGNYNPAKKEETNENDSDYSEEVVVTAPTGENRNYTLFIIIGIVSFVVILIGTIIIKKKVLK